MASTVPVAGCTPQRMCGAIALEIENHVAGDGGAGCRGSRDRHRLPLGAVRQAWQCVFPNMFSRVVSRMGRLFPGTLKSGPNSIARDWTKL